MIFMIKLSIRISLIFIFFSFINIYAAPVNSIRSNSIEKQKEEIFTLMLFKMSKKELIKICRQLKISSAGSKKDIRSRIINYLKVNKIVVNKITKTNKSEFKPEENKDTDRIIIENAVEGEYLKVDNSDEEILSAKGEVYLRYNKVLLRADELRLNVKTKEMLCQGNVILWDGKKELTGDKIFYDLNTRNGIIYDGRSEIGQIVYYGGKIEKIEKGPYIIDKGRFTSCKNHKPHYYIEASKIWVYPDDKIVLFNAYYIVSGVKLFWIPLYFRFEKGTGIITSWGKRRVDGWYMQNTYRTKITSNDELLFKFDHYQKRGEYAGIDYRKKSANSDIIASVSGAYDKKLFGDSNVNPETGEVERSYRGKISFRNRYTFNRNEKNKNYNTDLKMNFFRQSDYAYIRDFEQFRSTKPGFHYYQNPIYNNDIYNQNNQNWYINLFDKRKNSSLLIKANWNFQWNSLKTNYFLNRVTAPYIKYELHGYLFDNPELKTTSKSNFFKFDPKIRYNAFVSFQHDDYYDINGEYLKSVDYRQISGSAAKTFNLIRFFNYSFGFGLGNNYYLPYNVSDSEANNYERNSFSYGRINENLQLGVSSFNLKLSHNYQWRFEEYSADSVYGKVVQHSLGISHINRIIPGITYTASTGYDLKYPKDEKFTHFEKDRFSDLNNNLYVNIIEHLSINDRYIYSIRYSQPVRNNLSVSYSLSSITLYDFLINSVSLSAVWNHYFPNPISSKMYINFNMRLKLSRYWSIRIATHSENNKLYLYSKSLAEEYGTTQYGYRNFFTDLFNSVNIFDIEKMKDSYFKLKRAEISVQHDLHCWQMSFGYSLQQRYFYYGTISQYPYFEHSFWFKINMKIETHLGIDEKIKTEPPTVVEY